MEKRQKSRPLLVLGNGVDVGGSPVSHAWVIDGYALYKYTFEMSPLYGATTSYFHCVWGWGGKNNGYFALSNGFSGQPYDKEADEGDDNAELGYKFTDYLQYKSNFEPNK